MRKLLLTSNGLTPELSETVLKLFDTKPEETTVAFIATASEEETDKGYVLKDRAAFEALGFKEVVDVDIKQPEEFAKLDACQVIFVEGGNTYYLLSWIRKSGFDQKVKELLSNDKFYIGASAGSMVLGTSIETASLGINADRNFVGLEDPRALRQVPFMIAPHFEEAHQAELDAFAKKAALRPIVGLEDGQAILCVGDRYKLLGPENPHTWNSKLFK